MTDQSALFTLSRSSRALVRTAAGAWAEVLPDQRAITDLGWDITEGFTNIISNPRAEGAVIGTPGTSPSGGWDVGGSSVPGLTRQIVGIGTVDGVPELQVRFSGTTTAAGSIYLYPSSLLPLTVGQAYAFICGLRLVSGSIAGVTNITQRIWGTLTNPTLAGINLTASVKRQAVFGVALDSARPLVQITIPTGTVIDFTLGISAPVVTAISSYLGPELAPTQFGAGWQALGAGTITLAGGAASFATSGGATVATTASIASAAGCYRISYDVTAYTSGSVRGYSQAAYQQGAYKTAAGTYTDYVVASATTWLGFSTAGAATLTLANISIRRVYPGYIPMQPILPTVGTVAASIRYAEAGQCKQGDGGTPWLGYAEEGYASGWGALAEVSLGTLDSGMSRAVLSARTGDGSQRVSLAITADQRWQAEVIGGDGVSRVSTAPAAIAVTGITRAALIWDGTSIQIRSSAGDGAAVAVPAGGVPAALTAADVGRIGAGAYLNARLRKLHLMPVGQITPAAIASFIATGDVSV